MAEVAQLKEKIRQLEAKLNALKGSGKGAREKISEMSSEVVDSNPYRLLINNCVM